MPPFPNAQRESGIALSGEAAVDWLAAKNYQAELAPRNLRVFGDWIEFGDLSLGRIYHNAPTLVRNSAGPGVALLIVVDGAVRVSQQHEEWNLEKGDALAMPRASRVALCSVGPYGVVDVELGEGFTGRYAIQGGAGPARIPAGAGILRLLIGVSSLTLTIAPGVAETDWRHIREVIEVAAGGMLRHADYGTAGPYVDLLRRARDTIGRRACDPDFSVALLCSALAVSPALLHRAFATIGTTPLTEIRRERVASARRLLERRRSPSAVEMETVATLSGFRSLRALRTASRAIEARAGGR